jgi:hypothetical protein
LAFGKCVATDWLVFTVNVLLIHISTKEKYGNNSFYYKLPKYKSKGRTVSAIQHSPEIREYYLRKTAEGKNQIRPADAACCK